MTYEGICMTYDFDAVIDRHGTGSLKYDCAERRGKSADLLPMWVADMDFRIPQEAVDALVARCEHGIFGYTEPDDSYFAAACSWIERHQGWRPDPETCTLTPGVVFALAAAVRAYSEPGDAVLIQPPVYYPFREVIEDNGRVVARAPLTYANGSYGFDATEFEHVVSEERPALFLLCNPHNPVGRVWAEDELRAMGDICLAHGVTVVSDKITRTSRGRALRTRRSPRWASPMRRMPSSARRRARPSTWRACRTRTSSCRMQGSASASAMP